VNCKELNQYYTKTEVARECIAYIKQIYPSDYEDYYDIFLEPSAGTGSFFELLPANKRLGLDIEPKCFGVIQGDFLQYGLPTEWSKTTKRIITIGNPPFGVQSKYAVQFFNHAAKYSDTIAFIVPVVWEKWSIHRRLDTRFALIFNKRLKPFSFVFNNLDYDVKCTFQIWTTRKIGTTKWSSTTNKRILTAPLTTHPDFVFLPKAQRYHADFLFVVCGARKQLVREVDDPVAIQTTERIKCHVSGVRQIFEKIDWSKYASANTGTMWINRETIVKEYESIKIKEKEKLKVPFLTTTESLDVKYRPKCLEDLVGQNEIVNTLRGMFESGKINHTIMLYGSAGSGKTSIARIIARYINCTGDKLLCGECSTCKLDKIEDHPDIHELNMANATGVDNARELINQSLYLPESNFRVYILDEFHMSTPAARECFLKPLEEPPEHVVWILCTTEPEKFKDTILGRCLKFQTNPLEYKDLAKLLYKVAVAEKSIIAEDKKSLIEISKLVRGQPRDGLKALEKVIYYVKGKGKIDLSILPEIIKEVVDLPPSVLVSKYLLSVYMGKYATALTILKNIQNVEYFLKSLIDFHTNMLYASVKKNLVGSFPAYSRLIEEMQKLNIKISSNIMANILTDMVSTHSHIKSYTMDAGELLLAMTCRIINIINS
jgi:DNA polymerase III subunit gamma/tau